jgi:hypothetical protein
MNLLYAHVDEIQSSFRLLGPRRDPSAAPQEPAAPGVPARDGFRDPENPGAAARRFSAAGGADESEGRSQRPPPPPGRSGAAGAPSPAGPARGFPEGHRS